MEKPYVLGIDVGGTNTVFGVVDARGNLIMSSSIKTGAHNDLDDYIKDLVAGIEPLLEQVGGKDKIRGIGVGAPNGNYYTGSIEFAPNLPWKKTQIPFAQILKDALGIPTALTNDANAAAIGEMTYGA
ncbi:ROK family protein, partial [Bacteroides heparinolyticus]|uniref:ROK family protein n=2 Tax=Bacteroidales TaxID=171549 RepID=UPI0035A135C0